MGQLMAVCIYSISNSLSSSVYSPFSDRVGLPPRNTPFPVVLMNSTGYQKQVKMLIVLESYVQPINTVKMALKIICKYISFQIKPKKL